VCSLRDSLLQARRSPFFFSYPRASRWPPLLALWFWSRSSCLASACLGSELFCVLCSIRWLLLCYAVQILSSTVLLPIDKRNTLIYRVLPLCCLKERCVLAVDFLILLSFCSVLHSLSSSWSSTKTEALAFFSFHFGFVAALKSEVFLAFLASIYASALISGF
jgi:hypothetical protein